MALAALASAPDAAESNDVRLLLHEALRALGDIPAAKAALDALAPRDDDERLLVVLLLGEDFHRLAAYDFYRASAEKARGLTGDEYAELYEGHADRAFAEALELAGDDPTRMSKVAESMRRCNRAGAAVAVSPPCPVPAPRVAAAVPQGCGTLHGRLRFADGSPVPNAVVTVGFPLAVTAPSPEGYLGRGIDGGIQPRFAGEQETRTTRTDDAGEYWFEGLPAATYPFVAATLPPDEYDVALRFFGRDVAVRDAADARCDGVLAEWTSAEPLPLPHPFAEDRRHGGRMLRRVALVPLRNPFHYDFPRQFVRLDLPAAELGQGLVAFVSHAPETPLAVQALADGGVGCFLDLPGRTQRMLAVYRAASGEDGVFATDAGILRFQANDDGGTAEVDTGRARFRIAWGAGVDAPPPIMALRGEDRVWRGSGRLRLPAGAVVASRSSELLESGPLRLRVAIAYRLSTGGVLRFELTAHRGEPYLLVHETSVPLEGLAFEFSLREFSGGRGFLHWTPEHGSVHWTTLAAADVEVARLQESVAWWIPPQGFGYAMTPDSLEQRDYVGVFTCRRGEWVDREFERLAQGPGDENRELDWPYPEMVGSTISMITARTTADGDAVYRFAGFDGERQWGLLVSTLDRNDGPHKEISSCQHKVSSPRLQDFLRWRLHERDALRRPFLLVPRDEVRALRRKRETTAFAPVWAKLAREHTRGPARGLRALVESDAALAWRLSREMVLEAPLRARMTLLGRDYSDVYSPVGGRGITPFAEQYDLIAATGVFSPAEERDLRASLLLMGHLFMEEDFMNWRFNSRNANFEADRTDIVGAVGLAFRGNPDADTMVRHAAELMERSLEVYCTPGSGKWYENPACYYIHAASCRLNLAFHLYRHGILDVTRIDRLRDFLAWGPLLLTAPYPHAYALLRDGCSYDTYESAEKVRRIPPIGDHAKLGQWVSEFFALMGKVFQRSDPALANLLRWAYQEGGSDGGHFSKFPLYFTAMDETDLQPAPPQMLASRRLEGFGAVFRGGVGTSREFYLLFKQGPGGYRYHRTEGSFLLMAHGRPLVWDGGEAGETWRHSTLSFHDTHMPLAPGRVERFASLPSADFVQGVHPKALDPGDPVYLSDVCEHTLVDVAWQRFREPNPADVRVVLWVKDDYVVISDDLRLPPGTSTHWHLQAVGDAHEGSCGAAGGMRVRGRYGVDLQVLVPGLPEDARETVAQVPTVEYRVAPAECFSMRHIQLSMASPRRFDAVLRPLAPGAAPLRAETFDGGLRVRGEGVDDIIFLSRDARSVEVDGVRFDGRYGAVLRRADRTIVLLFEGRGLRCGEHCVNARGETSLGCRPNAAVGLGEGRP